MIAKIKVYLSIGYANAEHNDELDVDIPDDATETEAEELKEAAAQDWAYNFMDLGWSDVK